MSINKKQLFSLIIIGVFLVPIVYFSDNVKAESYNYPSLNLKKAEINANKNISQNGVVYSTCGQLDLNWCRATNPNASGNGPFEFKWGDGNVSCSWFPGSHNFSKPGRYIAKVRVKNTCGLISERSSDVLIENSYPVMEITSALIDHKNIELNGLASAKCGEIDENWCKKINPNASGNGPFEFKWGDGRVSCSWFSGTHTYNRSGSFIIKVRVKDTCGFISERSKYIF